MDVDGLQTMVAAASSSAPSYPVSARANVVRLSSVVRLTLSRSPANSFRGFRSNKKQIDWDQLDKEVSEELEGEKLEGDAALNKLFKDIYDRADGMHPLIGRSMATNLVLEALRLALTGLL